jgi:hypothetical protein
MKEEHKAYFLKQVKNNIDRLECEIGHSRIILAKLEYEQDKSFLLDSLIDQKNTLKHIKNNLELYLGENEKTPEVKMMDRIIMEYPRIFELDLDTGKQCGFIGNIKADDYNTIKKLFGLGWERYPETKFLSITKNDDESVTLRYTFKGIGTTETLQGALTAEKYQGFHITN